MLAVVTNFTLTKARLLLQTVKTVMFDCAVNNGSHPIYVNWHVHSQLIGINRFFDGSEGAFLSDGGDPLTLTSVTREMLVWCCVQ